ncbi:MAG: hypothetical protein COC05_06765 [Gammaproteobacteria bacterium]|nr:MAG: hypothetical protein COC05_06765 [Gammaproteobacteria bacterium]
MEKTGRNDPCPCGSGKKYKKCHGATVVESAVALTQQVYSLSPIPRPKSPQAPRPCGECSLCCDGWVKTHVLGHDIDFGKPCPFSSGQNCTIHEKRPDDPCRAFFCGWAEPESDLPDWLQPHQSGVIMLSGRATWSGRPVDVLVSAGQDPDEKVLGWFHEYSMKHMRPFIYQRDEQWYAFGPKAFQRVVSDRVAKGQDLFH